MDKKFFWKTTIINIFWPKIYFILCDLQSWVQCTHQHLIPCTIEFVIWLHSSLLSYLGNFVLGFCLVQAMALCKYRMLIWQNQVSITQKLFQFGIYLLTKKIGNTHSQSVENLIDGCCSCTLLWWKPDCR